MKKILLLMGVLLMSMCVNAYPYVEGEKVYLFDYGGLSFGRSDANYIQQNYTYIGNYMTFTQNDGGAWVASVNLYGAGEYYIYIHSDCNGNVDIYPYDAQGVLLGARATTKTALGDGTYTYTLTFSTGRPRIRMDGCLFGVGTKLYLDSYIRLDSLNGSYEYNQAYNYVTYTHNVFGFPSYKGNAGLDRNYTYRLYAESTRDYVEFYDYEELEGYYYTQVEYYKCVGVGLEWIDCYQSIYFDNYTDGFWQTRKCGRWVNFTENLAMLFDAIPQENNFSSPMFLRAGVRRNFTIIYSGLDVLRIEWRLWETGIEGDKDRNLTCMDRYDFDSDSLDLHSGIYTLQADVISLCNKSVYAYQWYLDYGAVYNNVSGIVYRYNTTDTWNVTNGSIRWGYNTGKILDGYYELNITDGCNYVTIWDYDKEGTVNPAYESTSQYCYYHDTEQNFAIPTRDGWKEYNLTICLYDAYDMNIVIGTPFTLYRNSSFYDIQTLNSSGCAVFQLWYNTIVLGVWDARLDRLPIKRVYHIFANKEYNYTVQNRTLDRLTPFYVYDENYHPIRNALIDCGSDTTFTDINGVGEVQLILGNAYNCTISHEFYFKQTKLISNLTSTQATDGFIIKLNSKGTTRLVKIYTVGIEDEGDYPLGNATVKIQQLQKVEDGIYSEGNYSTEIMTNTDGYAEITLLQGLYKFSAYKDGYYTGDDAVKKFNIVEEGQRIRLRMQQESLTDFFNFLYIDTEEELSAFLMMIVPAMFIIMLVTMFLRVAKINLSKAGIPDYVMLVGALILLMFLGVI